jgi:hypothetical protein
VQPVGLPLLLLLPWLQLRRRAATAAAAVGVTAVAAVVGG